MRVSKKQSNKTPPAALPSDPVAGPPKVEVPTTRLEQWQAAAASAARTGRMANTLAKALAQRTSQRWRFVDFLGPSGRESAGIVDIVAIRKSGSKPEHPAHPQLKSLDLFDITLIQVKGGSAPKPTEDDIQRLKAVKGIYRAKAIVLFQWRKGVASGFYLLDEETHAWVQTPSKALFGS